MQTTTQIAHTPEKTNARSHHAEFGDYNVNFYKQQCCTHINQTKPNLTEPFQIHLIWYMHDGKRDKCENETWHRFIALHLSWTIVSMVGHFLPKRWIYNIVMDTVCAMATIEHWVLTIQFDSTVSNEHWFVVDTICRHQSQPYTILHTWGRMEVEVHVCVSTMYICKWHHQLSTWHYLSPVFIINVFND